MRPKDACIGSLRAPDACVSALCAPNRRASPARCKDARSGRNYRAETGSSPALVTAHHFSLVLPTIRDEREGGSGYKKPPPPTFTKAPAFLKAPIFSSWLKDFLRVET